MTIENAYREGRRRLEQAGIGDAAIDAWYLLEHVTGVRRAEFYMNPDMPVEGHENAFFEMIGKRCRHIPLQHLTGVQEFMGMEFEVNEHVLIPRQDTEVLVETTQEYLQEDMQVLDMCTGSGCIIISLQHHAGQYGMTKVRMTGSDISGKALDTAGRNAVKNHTDISWVESNLFDNIEGSYDLIVSNPPYIRTSVIEKLQEEVKLHDPYIALDGKEDGLYFYRRIIEGSTKHLNHMGRLIFEIGYDQGEDVRKLMDEAGYREITVKKDLAGLDRVVTGVYNK